MNLTHFGVGAIVEICAFSGIGCGFAVLIAYLLRSAVSTFQRCPEHMPKGTAILALIAGGLALLAAGAALLTGGSMLLDVVRGAGFNNFATQQMITSLASGFLFLIVAGLSIAAGIRVLLAPSGIRYDD
jgi:hypothetical protein